MRLLTFHEEAGVEVNEAATYYEERMPGLGVLFLGEAVQTILAHPEASQLVGSEVRRYLVRRFPYSLLYVVESDRIRVLAVAHQKPELRFAAIG